MRALIADLNSAIRTLLGKPGHTLIVVLTLALGIGANAAIFGVIDGLLLRPLPYPDGERLVAIFHAMPKAGLERGGSTVPDYMDERTQADALADVALYKSANFNLSVNATPERLRALRATPSLFSTLAVAPLVGRVFDAEEGVPGRDKVVVLSYDTWQTRFAGDRGAIGRDVRMDGEAYRIIGVMPPGFAFPDRNVQLWTPYAIAPEQATDAQRGHSDALSIGRLKPDAAIAALQAQLGAIAQRNADRSSELRADYESSGFVVHAVNLREDWFGALRPALWLLQAMVALVLIITCANVANLMLLRMDSRRKEFALRAALGARGTRLTAQIMLEALLLATLGGSAGIALAAASAPLIGWSGLDAALRAHAVGTGVDAALLGFVFALALMVGIVLGALTATALRRDAAFEQLRSGGRANAVTPAGGATRNGLVVAQIALAVTLLVSAGLLLQSFRLLLQVSPGFVTDSAVTAKLDLPRAKYPDAAAQTRYYERVLDGVHAVAAVRMAAYTSSLPFGGHLGTSGYEVEGYAGADAQSLEAQRQSVDESYFAAMGIALVEGRAFAATDTADASPVVIVDELLAKRIWPGRSALGQHVRVDSNTPWQTVVGVARSVHHTQLAGDPVREAMYWPYRQHAVDFGYLIVKSDAPAAALASALRSAVLAIDPELPPFDIRTLDDRIRASLDDRRAPMLLLAALALLGLALAAIGIYGVLAFAVAQRAAELGVRMAIGARGLDIVRLVLGSATRLVVAGAAIGTLGAIALARCIDSQLYGVSPIDPVVYCAVLAVLGAVAMLACYLPARRAARVDPNVALRYE